MDRTTNWDHGLDVKEIMESKEKTPTGSVRPDVGAYGINQLNNTTKAAECQMLSDLKRLMEVGCERLL